MYINNFLESLGELREDKVPTDLFLKDGVIYQTEYKKIIKDGKLIQYIGYNKEDDLNHSSTEYIEINKYISYMSRLNKIHLDLRDIRMSAIDCALMEAVVLFDKLAQMNDNPYIASELYDGARTVLIAYDRPDELVAFQTNPLKRDILLAQFEYFIKQYLSIKLKCPYVSQHKGLSMNLRFRNAVANYLNNDNVLDMNPSQENPVFKEFLKKLN